MALPRELLHTVECVAKEELGLVRDPTKCSQEGFTHVVVKNQAEDKLLYLVTLSRKLLNLYSTHETTHAGGGHRDHGAPAHEAPATHHMCVPL